MIATDKLGVRWTLGDVSDNGFEALRLSIWGAWKVFGPSAAYAVCVNTVPLDEARARTGKLPGPVAWRAVTEEDFAPLLAARLDEGKAEGVGWKLAPLRAFPDRYELSLDNDCILWEMPDVIRLWLAMAAQGECGPAPGDKPLAVIAEDVKACFGQFSDMAGMADSRPINLGIRGLPPGFDFEGALRATLDAKERAHGRPVEMTSELDEQGLQLAALLSHTFPLIVTKEDVTVCSPFWPHIPHLGRCGAHFVGLNARHIPWDYYDRPADECEAEHWEKHRSALYALTGTPPCAA